MSRRRAGALRRRYGRTAGVTKRVLRWQEMRASAWPNIFWPDLQGPGKKPDWVRAYKAVGARSSYIIAERRVARPNVKWEVRLCDMATTIGDDPTLLDVAATKDDAMVVAARFDRYGLELP